MDGFDHTAVVVVDVQGDFTLDKKGSLAVAGTDRDYLDQVELATRKLKSLGLIVVATQDWHPNDHISFYTNTPKKEVFDTTQTKGRTQVLWPPHCVQNTKNARILVDNSLFDAIVKKGTNPDYDSYSGFFDDNGVSTGLDGFLKNQGVKSILVYGLTTDYCAKATSMDGLKLGYEVFLVEDLCRGVAKDTTRSALKEMEAAGIRILPGLPPDLSDIINSD